MKEEEEDMATVATLTPPAVPAAGLGAVGAAGREARIDQRAAALFGERKAHGARRLDRMFVRLAFAQWAFAILVAVLFSPYAWSGREKAVHLHVYMAVLVGGALTALPVALALLRPGWVGTRHVIAATQMLWSALLIHLTGGRIETHFHVFGSLAFLSFYYEWPVLLTATVVVAADHVVRQLVWPESVYGIANPEWWRFLEHAFWVVFEDVFLVIACLAGVRDMRKAARQQAEVEVLAESDELKTLALEMALDEARGR
jgi:two-component system, NtrC family, sensor histidine kinase HydH